VTSPKKNQRKRGLVTEKDQRKAAVDRKENPAQLLMKKAPRLLRDS
jgi:phage gp37-like protein